MQGLFPFLNVLPGYAITVDCLFSFCRFAESHSCDNLENAALSYVHRHFPQVCESEEFLDTPKEIVIQFLESEHVKVDSEFQV